MRETLKKAVQGRGRGGGNAGEKTRMVMLESQEKLTLPKSTKAKKKTCQAAKKKIEQKTSAPTRLTEQGE